MSASMTPFVTSGLLQLIRLVCGLFHIHFLEIVSGLFLAPSAAPEEIKVEGRSSTSITIRWDPVPCADHNGNITTYMVMFRKSSGGDFQNENSKSSKREFTITGLEPSTMYEIKVAAFTVAIGPFTNKSLFASTLGINIA